MKTVHKKPRAAKPLTREAVKGFLAEATDKVAVRDIARAFNVPPEEKKKLRGLLKSLTADGALDKAGAKKYRETGRLPENAVVEITGIDRDGEAIARPVAWEGPGRPPVIFMHAEAKGQAALAPGARGAGAAEAHRAGQI